METRIVHIKEIDGEPFLNFATSKFIEKRDLPFSWGGHCFRLKASSANKRDVCCECHLDSICDSSVSMLCESFDNQLGGCHLLELEEFS